MESRKNRGRNRLPRLTSLPAQSPALSWALLLVLHLSAQKGVVPVAGEVLLRRPGGDVRAELADADAVGAGCAIVDAADAEDGVRQVSVPGAGVQHERLQPLSRPIGGVCVPAGGAAGSGDTGFDHAEPEHDGNLHVDVAGAAAGDAVPAEGKRRQSDVDGPAGADGNELEPADAAGERVLRL